MRVLVRPLQQDRLLVRVLVRVLVMALLHLPLWAGNTPGGWAQARQHRELATLWAVPIWLLARGFLLPLPHPRLLPAFQVYLTKPPQPTANFLP